MRTDNRESRNRTPIPHSAIQSAIRNSKSALHSALRTPPPAVRIALAAVGFRLVSALLALFVNLAFPLHQREQFTVFGSTSPFWDTFARWDSGYFQGIARAGYAPLAGGRSNIAYFPVYPMLVRAVARPFGRQPAAFYLAAIAIAWLSFVLAMVALYYLARHDLPPPRAERAVLLTMIFPFSFFFGAAYSESTFLLFVLLAFYGFRTRHWLLNSPGQSVPAFHTAWRSLPGVTPGPTAPVSVNTGTP